MKGQLAQANTVCPQRQLLETHALKTKRLAFTDMVVDAKIRQLQLAGQLCFQLLRQHAAGATLQHKGIQRHTLVKGRALFGFGLLQTQLNIAEGERLQLQLPVQRCFGGVGRYRCRLGAIGTQQPTEGQARHLPAPLLTVEVQTPPLQIGLFNH